MASIYLLDFDQVAQVGRSSRHRPTFPLAQLNEALDKEVLESYTVQQNRRFHHNAWFLPLYEAHVRAYLKRVLFNKPPVVSAGGVEFTCGREVLPEEVAAWVAHYGSGFFTPQYLANELEEFTQGRRAFAYGKEEEYWPRLLALRQLLRKEEDG